MRGMPQKESVEVPVSSYDCSACFSKEEWALLHEWQKELYKNVMNEIHSALISLGYTIHGTLLRMNGGEAVHIRDPEHSESRADTNDSTYHSTSCGFEDLPSCSYISGSLPSCTYPTPKPLDNLLNEDLQEPGETACCPSVNTAKLFTIKHEEEQDLGNQGASEGMGIISNATTSEPVLSVVIRADENTCLADPVETDRRAQNNYLSAELLIAPVKIKEEKVFFAVDHENFKFRKNDHPRCASDRPEGSDYFSTGDGSLIMKKNVGNSWNDKSTPCSSGVGKIKGRMTQSFERTRCERVMWSVNDHELKGEKAAQRQNDYSQVIGPTLLQKPHYMHRSDTCNQSESAIKNITVLPCELGTVQTLRLLETPQIDHPFSQNDAYIRQQRKRTQKDRYSCTECGKSFSQKSKLLKHERIHAEKSLYHCTVCGKNFSEKGVLIRHQKIHTREKPFNCSVCGTSFNEKGVLLRHQKIHTGEKPHQCTMCGKSFSRKDALIRHQTIHTKDKADLGS